MRAEIVCRLASCGATDTKDEVIAWADALIDRAKTELCGDITAHLWAFRHPVESRSEMLSCDFRDGSGGRLAVTFVPGFPYDFFGTEPKVPDMAEAIHMAGLLIRGLGASTIVGQG